MIPLPSSRTHRKMHQSYSEWHRSFQSQLSGAFFSGGIFLYTTFREIFIGRLDTFVG